MMELRSKPIAEAITKDRDLQGGSRFIEYCPGDGTRYELVFTPVGDAPSGTSDSVLVTLVNFSHSPSMLVERGHGFLAVQFVEEKLGIRGASAITLTEIIARFTDRDALSPEHYRAQHG